MRLQQILPVVAAIPLLAQTPAPEPVKRSVSRLVEVNVVVRDHNGPVTGLTQKDFTVFDKGKEQKIVSFVASRNPAKPQAYPPGAFANRPNVGEPPAGITVVMLDALNTYAQTQAVMRAAVVKALGEIKPPNRVLLGVLGEKLQLLPDRNAEGGEALEPWIVGNSVTSGMNIDNRLHHTADALITIANELRYFTGRKSLVWIAGSYPVSVDHYGAEGPPGFEDQATNISAAASSINAPVADPTQIDRQVFKRTFAPAMEALNLSALAVYEVDARGLVETAGQQTNLTPVGTSSRRNQSSPGTNATLVPTGTGALRILAEDSGGRAFESSNDIQKAVRLAAEDAEATYTIGFVADAKALDSQFHSLKVQVDRKDVDLHYRKGYVALPEPKNADALRTDAIRQALVSPLMIDGIGLLGAYEKTDHPKPGSLKTTVLIYPGDLALEQNGEQMVGELEITLTPRSADGKDCGTRRQAVSLNLPRAEYESVMRRGLPFDTVVETTGEPAELRVVVCDRRSGRLGSLIMPVK